MVGARISGSSLVRARAASCFCLLVLSPLCLPRSIASQDKAGETAPRDVARGKKLILKDGTYQVVREYQRNGDRVRYFSTERGDWEEIPAALIDWDATAKDAASADKASEAEVEKIHRSEEAKRMDAPLDIDASLPVAQGVYLPTGEGLFVVEGKSVRLLEQAGSNSKA